MDDTVLTTVLFLAVVALTIGITFRASRATSGTSDFYAGGRSLLGHPERPGDRRRLHVGRLVPRHLRRHRALGLRRLPLLHRLPGRLAGGPAARRRDAAQLRQVHDGRPARLPDEAAPGAHGGRDLHRRRLDLLPARADGRRGPRSCALLLDIDPDQHPRRQPRHRRRRRADDLLRHRRRHEGHHLGADRQGRPADGRLGADRGPGADRVRLQPQRAARCRRRRTPARQASSTPASSTALTETTKIDFLSLGLALVLGTAGLPHILVRFYTVPTARDARKSVLWAIGIIGVFYLFTLVLGFGAAALLDTGPEPRDAPPARATSPRPCSPRRSVVEPAPPAARS